MRYKARIQYKNHPEDLAKSESVVAQQVVEGASPDHAIQMLKAAYKPKAAAIIQIRIDHNGKSHIYSGC